MFDFAPVVTFLSGNLLEVSQTLDMDAGLEITTTLVGAEILDIVLDQQSARCVGCLKH